MLAELNKHQLILLTLLISFVTSIATGIITFSLLQQAPPTVTQTINRVVEQTIQQVTAPIDSGGKSLIKETTVVVKEDDQVVGAISKNTASLVRVSDNTTTPNPFYSLGVVLTKDGLVVVPVRDTFNAGFTYTAKFSDGSTQTLRYLGQDSKNTAIFFKINSATSTAFIGSPVVLEKSLVKLGQTVVLLEGETKNIISIGHISTFTYSDPNDLKTQVGLETDITPKTSILGSLLLNLSGELAGIRIGSIADPVYLSPETLATAIGQYSK